MCNTFVSLIYSKTGRRYSPFNIPTIDFVLMHVMEFSGNTYPFAEICVHGRWQIGQSHSIPRKITLLFIVNFYNQLIIEKIL